MTASADRPAARVLFVSSEVAPLAKTGGLADVASALPQALTDSGHEVRVVMPAYDTIDADSVPIAPHTVDIAIGPHHFTAGIRQTVLGNVEVILIDIPSLYHRGRIYTEDPDEHLRFAVLGWAALELCRAWDWSPDVIHCNDWQTGLIPLYLHTTHRQERFARTGTVLTIHNLAYQGGFSSDRINDVGLEPFREWLHQGHLGEGWFGFLETGLGYADILTTVSPTYAREILSPEYGAGLDWLLRKREEDLYGILNGIDTTVWDPATDPYLPYQYDAGTLWRKEWNKQRLLEDLGLAHDPDGPVFGLVSRMVGQKGIGLIPGPMAGILESTDARFVALGSGDPELEGALRGLEERFGDQVRFVSGYDEALSHRIEGSVDSFLMPSQYEPCGLNQMYSLAYGTPPIVRKTGGLADTVEPWDPASGAGTGFVFEHFDEGGVWWALNQTLDATRNPTAWKQIQLQGMAIDNSWASRAAQYADLYAKLTAAV